MQASCDSGTSPEVRFQEREGCGSALGPEGSPLHGPSLRWTSAAGSAGGGINRAIFSVFPRAVRGTCVTSGLARLADAAGSGALRFLSFRGEGGVRIASGRALVI